MTDPNDTGGNEGAAGGDEWSSVNLNEPTPDPAASPPPGYSEQPQGFTAPQPGYGDPSQPAPAPQPGYAQPGYTAPQPGYAQPGYAQPGYAQPGYPAAGAPDPYAGAYGYPAYPPQGSETDGLAIASLVCGVLALMCCLTGPVALVLGIVSLRNQKNSGLDAGANRGMAIAGVILGALSSLIIVVYAVIMIIGAVAGSV